jgi:hypothetical protein
LHEKKQLWPSFSTEEGMQINESDEQEANASSLTDGRNKQLEKADASIDESVEPDSNVTVERDLHRHKQ